MTAYSIISYCIDNFGYAESEENSLGTEIFYSRGGGKYFFLGIREFDSEGDTLSRLDRHGVFRVTLRLSKDKFNALFSKSAKPDKSGYITRAPEDYDKKNKITPHPVLSGDYCIQCLNPEEKLFETLLKELIAESYRRARSEYLSEKS